MSSADFAQTADQGKSYWLTLQIEEGSEADLNTRAVAQRDNSNLEDAALKILAEADLSLWAALHESGRG